MQVVKEAVAKYNSFDAADDEEDSTTDNDDDSNDADG